MFSQSGGTSMRIFYAPAVYLMNRLKYRQKFAVIFLLLLLPLMIGLGYYATEINNKIEKAREEHTGLVYSKALRTMIQHVQQHNGAAGGFLAGNTQMKDVLS